MVFTGIVLQALPFMLLGALLSSVLSVFVPDRLLIKLFPQKYGLGFLTALFAGALFPVCECAAIPLMRSLIRKGVSMPIAVTFMLASPIVNPISIIATLYAFPQQPFIAFYRLYFGLTIACGVGLVLLFYPEEKYVKDDSTDFVLQPIISANGETAPDTKTAADESFPHPADRQRGEAVSPMRRQIVSLPRNIEHTLRLATGRGIEQEKLLGYERLHDHRQKLLYRLQSSIYAVLMHSCTELFTAGPFLILGAFMTALIRTAVPQEFFGTTVGDVRTALFLMMLFAFLFSACSTSDAFIARSFLTRFPLGSILGFLVYGPMMDIKNMFMLCSLFKKRFVIDLVIIVTILNLIGISAFLRVFSLL